MVEAPNLPRAAVVGLLAAVVGMGLWYALAVSTGLRWGAVAMLIGLLVGIGTAWGAGRRGDLSVVVMSVAFYAFALIGGQYMIHNHFYQQDLARWAEAETVEDDGDYTPDETRLLLGIAEDEWQEMSQEQREFWRGALEAEYADEMLGYEDEDLISPEGEGEEAAAQMPASLPLGEFLGRLPAYIGVFGFIFLAVGGFEAFKFAAGSDS